MTDRKSAHPGRKKMLWLVAIALIIGAYVLLILVSPPEPRIGAGKAERSSGQRQQQKSQTAPLPDDSGGNEHLLDIKGYMTLGEVSRKHEVPVSVLREGLGIPATVPATETLGRIKKRYRPFRMTDVEQVILRYRSKGT